MPQKTYHLIIIGAGSGGLVAAAGAAGLGVKVALIEKHKMGGDCLNTGCVPSKAIIRTAKLVYDMKTAHRFGLQDVSCQPDLAKIMASVREVQANLHRHDSVERFQSLGVDVYQGDYHFVSPNEVTDGSMNLSSKRFVISTGSSPYVPPIKGLSEVPYLTSENIWQLNELPKRLAVLGGGPIGSELSQVFCRLGSHVSIVEVGDCMLSREDLDASCLVKERFQREGINTLVNSKAEEIVKGSNGFELVVANDKGEKINVLFDQILIATGRAPNVEGLGLEQAGVEYTQRRITTDAFLRTTNKNIYACGDVAGPYQFTHTADFQARLILRNALFPGKSKINYRMVPWCTFTEPEVARAGLNEKEAQKNNVAYDVFTYPMKDLDRAVCDREDEGFIKVLTKKGSDRILGVTLVGPHAGDLLHELALAIHQKIGLKKLALMIHVYPTLAEVSKRLVDTYQRSRLSSKTKRWLKRYFEWKFG